MFDSVSDDRNLLRDAAAAPLGVQSVAPRPACVPRRFSLGMLLVVVAMYALLFAGLRLLNASPLDCGLIGGFLTVVGLAQMLLFGGQYPRTASIIAGTCVMTLASTGLFIAQDRKSPEDFIVEVSYAVIFGPFVGYLTGLAVAGVFYVANQIEEIRNGLVKRRPRAAPKRWDED